MRMVRIASGESAGTCGHLRSSRRTHLNLIRRLLCQVRQFSVLGVGQLRLPALELADHGPSTADCPCRSRLEGESQLDAGARRLAPSLDLRALREDPFPGAVSAASLRHTVADVGMANGRSHSLGSMAAQEATPARGRSTGLEADDTRLDLGKTGPDRSGTIALLTHRIVLDSRKKVATFVRTFADEGEDYLRAFFVDDRCTYLSSKLLARSTLEILNLRAERLFDEAMLAGASGIILARGIHPSTDTLSPDERCKADAIYSQAQENGVHLLDYIIVGQAHEKGLFAVRPLKRCERW